jgi:hypothetical protein
MEKRMKTRLDVSNSWIDLNVRQQRAKGQPIGGEAIPDNRLGRRVMAKLQKKAAAKARGQK